MISSVFALKEANTIPEYLVHNKVTKVEENYYSNNVLDFLLECHEELLSYRQDFYKSVMEASEENPYLITESYEFILSNIKKIIKKILAYIETLVRKFSTQLPKIIQSDKYILSKKKDIEKFPKNKSFKISGYHFTIDENIPIVDIIGLDLSELQDKMKGIDASNITSKISQLTGILAELSDERKMDDIRGQILKTNPITETSFGNQLFTIFRDGKSQETDIEIKRDEVIESLENFTGYDKKLKEVRRLQNQISVKYRNLERQVEDIIKLDTKIDGSSKTNDVMNDGRSENTVADLKNILNNLLIAQTNQIQRIANLHVQAIACKLDAYNSALIQDRNILYRALNIVQSDTNNTFIMKESSADYDYTRDIYYRGYVLEKHFMNENQKRFVEECLVLSENNFPGLESINEDLKMDIKNKYEKLKKLLKDIFEKFKQKITEMSNNTKDFLAKHKDNIINKKVKPYVLNNMPKYSAGIRNIDNTNLPNRIDVNRLESLSELQIQQLILPGYKGDEEFSEYAKRFFLCDNTENKDIQSTDPEIDMVKIYNFCTDTARLNNLNKDIIEVNGEVTKVQSVVTNEVQESAIKDYLGRNYIYSNVLEAFINEEGEDKQSSSGIDIKSNDSTSGDKDDSKSNLNIPKEDQPDNKNDDKSNNPNDKKEDSEKKTTNIEKTKKLDIYLKNLRIAITAKLTAFQKIFSEYMKIIKYHVKSLLGKIANEDEIRNAMKEYMNADENNKEAAADKVVEEMKKAGRTITRDQVDGLVKKNAEKLK